MLVALPSAFLVTASGGLVEWQSLAMPQSNKNTEGAHTVNHWTIRTRILASFALILLVMALTAVVAHNRLSAIDREVGVQQKDALPGLHYSAALSATWSELYVLGWRTLTASNDAERRLLFEQSREASRRLDAEERDYETTIFRDEDRARFRAYKEIRANYDKAAHIFSDSAAWPGTIAAEAALHGPLYTHWIEGHKAIQAVVADNDSTAQKAAANISGSVDLAKTSIEVSLLVAVAAISLTEVVTWMAERWACPTNVVRSPVIWLKPCSTSRNSSLRLSARRCRKSPPRMLASCLTIERIGTVMERNSR